MDKNFENLLLIERNHNINEFNKEEKRRLTNLIMGYIQLNFFRKLVNNLKLLMWDLLRFGPNFLNLAEEDFIDNTNFYFKFLKINK